MATINLNLGDCLEAMRAMPDKAYDLAIVDPPYGININNNIGRRKGEKHSKYKKVEWDSQTPPQEYFDELKRVSVNQIIWGANYMIDKIHTPSACWIVWDKDNSGDFADCELAFTSFNSAVRKFTWRWNGMLQQDMKNKEQRIHPTQKPVKLYEWLLINYAQRKCNHKHSEQEREFCSDCRNQDVKILDTHLGSGSIAIACHRLGFDLTACELDKDYFEAAMKRIKLQTAQKSLF